MTILVYPSHTMRDIIVPDSVAIDELRRVVETIEPISAPVPHKAPPVEVDLSKYLRYIRWQGGDGCWGYSLLSVWDIMNEVACPNSPNLSLNLGLFLHRRRDLWERQGGIYSPDERFHKKGNCLFNISTDFENELNKSQISKKLKDTFAAQGFPLPNNPKLKKPIDCKWQGRHYCEWAVYDEKWQYIFYIRKEDKKLNVCKPLIQWSGMSFGCTTEGTELTNPTTRWTGNWAFEGTNEAYNYRLADDVKKITVSSSEFLKWLAGDKPIQLEIYGKDWGHFVAVVGYDSVKKTFKYVNSAGDRWEKDGFGIFTFNDIDNGKTNWCTIGNAYVIDIIPPRSIPAARIRVTTPKDGGRRMNVNLWLSVEDSPLSKRKIWPPCDSGDDSRNLHYTVRLPSSFIWPPSPSNRLVLDLYDSGAFSERGGTLEEFAAAFGGHVVKCTELSKKGPVSFKARQLLRFYIP